MQFKTLTRLFLLIGMIGLFSHPIKADEIQIGSGSQTDANLPTHSYYKYSLTQQIYTATEIENAVGSARVKNTQHFVIAHVLYGVSVLVGLFLRISFT